MSFEMRQFKRFETFLIVEFRPFKTTQEYSIGITSNLSQDGFCYESQSLNPKPTEILEFKLKYPHSDLSVSALGEIVWKKEAWYNRKIGIKFGEIEQVTKGKLLELVSADRKHTELSVHGKNSETVVIHKEIEESIIELNTEAKKKLLLEIFKKDNKDICKHTDSELCNSVRKAMTDNIAPMVGRRQHKRRKNSSYIPLVVFLLVFSLIALPLVSENFKQGLITLISTTKSIFFQDNDKRMSNSSTDNNYIKELSKQELIEPM